MPETDGKLTIGADLDLLLDAARAVIGDPRYPRHAIRVPSAGNIQRHVRVGYVKAGRLLLLLEQEGVIARSGSGWTKLVPRDDLDAALERIRRSAGA